MILLASLLCANTRGAPGVAPSARAAYEVIPIRVAGCTASNARAINDAAKVVGVVFVKGSPQGFAWRSGRGRALGILNGWPDSQASAINGSGVVVGEARRHDGIAEVTRAIVWRNRALVDLGRLLGHRYSAAYGINDRDQVVGAWGDDLPRAGGSHAFLWDHGQLVDLGGFGGTDSGAYAINVKGQIVGDSRYPTGGRGEAHAFLWSEGKMHDLGTLGGKGSTARAINSSAEVVGESYLVDGRSHAFLWRNGTMKDLGTCPGCENSSANGINDDGVVVGSCNNEDSSIILAFVYRNGEISDLNGLIGRTSGWTLRTANAINNRGEIVGLGVLHGELCAYLLRPTPPRLKRTSSPNHAPVRP